MAGTRQYNNLLSLFDNWDQYEKALETSANAAGTLQKQQEIYMESTEAHLQKLRTEAERTYDVLFDQDTVNGFADTLTNMLSVFNNFLEGIGGGTSAIVFFGNTLANIFNRQIGSAIERQIENIEMLKANQDALQMKELVASNILQSHNIKGENIGSAGLEAEAETAQKLLSVKEALTDEDYNELTAIQRKIGLQTDQIEYLQEYKSISEDFFGSQNASIKQFEKMTKSLEDQLSVEEEIGVSLERDLRQYQLRSDMSEDEKTLLYNKVRQLGTIADTEDKINTLQNMRFKIASGEKLSEEEITVLLKEQENYLNLQKEQTARIKQGLEGRKAAEQGLTQELIRQRDAEQDYIDKKVALAERQKIISEGVKGLTSLVSLTISLSGLIKTINDDSLSATEKFERILPVLLMAAPQLITTFKSIGSIIPMLGIEFKALGNSIAAAATEMLGFEVAAAPVLITLTAIVAVLAVISIAAYNYAQKQDEANKSLERATATAEKATKAFQETKQAYENLQSSIEKYNSAEKALKTMVKDTVE